METAQRRPATAAAFRDQLLCCQFLTRKRPRTPIPLLVSCQNLPPSLHPVLAVRVRPSVSMLQPLVSLSPIALIHPPTLPITDLHHVHWRSQLPPPS